MEDTRGLAPQGVQRLHLVLVTLLEELQLHHFDPFQRRHPPLLHPPVPRLKHALVDPPPRRRVEAPERVPLPLRIRRREVGGKTGEGSRDCRRLPRPSPSPSLPIPVPVVVVVVSFEPPDGAPGRHDPFCVAYEGGALLRGTNVVTVVGAETVHNHGKIGGPHPGITVREDGQADDDIRVGEFA